MKFTAVFGILALFGTSVQAAPALEPRGNGPVSLVAPIYTTVKFKNSSQKDAPGKHTWKLNFKDRTKEEFTLTVYEQTGDWTSKGPSTQAESITLDCVIEVKGDFNKQTFNLLPQYPYIMGAKNKDKSLPFGVERAICE